ncbi:MAG: serine--tRNA ligase [bacterium]
MLDINFIRKEPDRVKSGLKKKGIDGVIIDRFLQIDDEWREKMTEIEQVRALKNQLGSNDREKGKEMKEKEKTLNESIDILKKERLVVLEQIPNLPPDDALIGKDESENVVLRTVGIKPEFTFQPKDYIDIAKALISTDCAAKSVGSRFGYLFGDMVLLEFGLVRLVMDTLLPHGFIPVIPPVMIKPDVMRGMGKVKFIEEGDAFYVGEDDLYLVGSAEHTIGPIHMNDVLNAEELPKRYVGFSTCFRREAGSYGKDTRGILRVHQFDKLEMFSFAHPDNSEEEHKFLLARQEELVQKLGLHYRVMQICTGDMGFGDYKQYDVETWLPGQGKYRETHSCSNTTDFQSRGINVKYKSRIGDDGKPQTEYAHLLNATAFAIGRILIAIIENYQTEKGTIIVPEVLLAYVGKKEIVPADTL